MRDQIVDLTKRLAEREAGKLARRTARDSFARAQLTETCNSTLEQISLQCSRT